MIQKHNDSVKPGVGIDGSKDDGFSRKHAVDPWTLDPYSAGKGAASARSKNDSIAGSRRGGVGDSGRDGDDILREVPIYEEDSYSPNPAFGTGTVRAGSADGRFRGTYDIFDDVQDQSSDDGTRKIQSRGQKASVESDPWRPRTKGPA